MHCYMEDPVIVQKWAYLNLISLKLLITTYFMISRAETIHRGFDFVRFVLLGSEFDSFSVFSVRSVSIFSNTYAKS